MKFTLFPLLCLTSFTGSVNASRVVGGEDADPTRFPYTVSLIDSFPNRHVCTGTMIAPDMVLTAAHCADEFDRVWINHYSISNQNSDFEDIPPEKIFPHPLHDDEARVHDVMLVKLSESSIHPTVRINTDSSMPVESQVLRVMGWGRTDPKEPASADVLQQLDVTYVTNEKCNIGQSFEDILAPSMMCAGGFNLTGTCFGDSGGPLIIPGINFGEDVQVGVTSFGFDKCQSLLYEDVYARLSEEYKWIRYILCQNSESPPDYFDCDAEVATITFSPSPTLAPSRTPSPSYVTEPVLVQIMLEYEPEDVLWYIRDGCCSSSDTVFQVLRNTYETPYVLYNQTVDVLRPDRTYTLIVDDSSYPYDLYGDVYVYLGTQPGKLLGHLDLTGTTSYNPSLSFTTSAAGIVPTAAPAAGPSSSTPVSLTGFTIPVLVWLRTDFVHPDTGWRIETSFGQIVWEVLPGFYREPITVYTESLALIDGDSYTFTITSAKNRGFDGEIIIVVGDVFSPDAVVGIFDGTTDYYYSFSEYDFIFTASFDSVIGVFPTDSPSVSPAPSFRPSLAPTESPTGPTFSPFPTLSKVDVLVYFDFERDADELGWRIESTNNGQVLFEVPMGTYNFYRGEASMALRLDAGQSYIIVLQNRYCCGLDGEAYIYLGNARGLNNILLYIDGDRYSFGYQDELRLLFTASPDAVLDQVPSVMPSVSPAPSAKPSPSPSSAPSGPTISPFPTVSSVGILVYIEFDIYEYETGWRIENTNGDIMYEELPGTYNSNNVFTLVRLDLAPEQEYVFVLVDSFCDGLWNDAFVYLGGARDDQNILVSFAYTEGMRFTCEWTQSFRVANPSPGTGNEVDPPDGSDGFDFCFSAKSTVQVKDKGNVRMSDLRLGDEVRVGNGGFEPIYSFGHWDVTTTGDFLQISMDKHGAIEINKNHMLFVLNQEDGSDEPRRRVVPASMVRPGDHLLLDGGEGFQQKSVSSVAVASVKTVRRQGAIAPFTPSGTIVVDGVVASVYVTMQDDSGTLKVGELNTMVSHHWIAHAFQTPHRLACYYFSSCPHESYNDAGISLWVERPLRFAKWLYDKEDSASWVFFVVCLIPILAIFAALTVVEYVVMVCFVHAATWNTFILPMIIAVALSVWGRKVAKKLPSK